MTQSNPVRMSDAPSRKPLLSALRGEKSNAPPVWLMRQAGRYLPEYRAARARAGTFLELCDRPDLAAEVTLQPVRRFGLDAAIIFADILLVPRALGQFLTFVEGEGPALEPLKDPAGIARLNFDNFDSCLAPTYDALRIVSGELPGSTALIGFAGAPWTVATYMVAGTGDQIPARLWAYRDPEGFARLIDLLADATIRHLSAQIAAGAEVVQIFDSWAGVLPESGFSRWCIEPTRKIVAALKRDWPEIPVIGFPRAAGALYEPYARHTGVDAVSIDVTVGLDWAREHLQGRVAVQGNLDPVALWAGGRALEREVADILGRLSNGPFVFNLGHGVLPQTPPEHVAALLELVRARRG